MSCKFHRKKILYYYAEKIPNTTQHSVAYTKRGKSAAHTAATPIMQRLGILGEGIYSADSIHSLVDFCILVLPNLLTSLMTLK